MTVDRILAQPALVQAVQALDPRVLGKLVRHVGLEDCGELVALATTEQLARVFDEDLWKSARPGADETFDASRFALWLAVLVDQSTALAARKLAELDEDLVTLALSKHLFVIDIEQLALRMSSGGYEDDADLLEKELDSAPYHEFEDYRVISRDAGSWDAIGAVLVELNEQDFGTLRRLLERCCDLSSEYIEDNGGLYEVLSAAQTAEADVAGAREDRREQAGYVAPSAALSLLRLTAQARYEDILASDERDPVTRAHFRASAPVAQPKSKPTPAPTAAAREGRGSAVAAPAQALEALMEELGAANVLRDSSPPGALDDGEAGGPAPVLTRALHALGEARHNEHELRMLELAYVANVLLAGCGTKSQRLRPVEAAELALATCNFGAEQLLALHGEATDRHVRTLAKHLEKLDLVKLFRLGLRRLCDVPPPAAISQQAQLLRLRTLLVRQKLCPSLPKPALPSR